MITDARRHPMEAGTMPKDKSWAGGPVLTVEDMWNLEIQGL